jgi:hypothetical protein
MMFEKSKLKGAACDLQHLLIFAYDFNILGLTGGKKLLAIQVGAH